MKGASAQPACDRSLGAPSPANSLRLTSSPRSLVPPSPSQPRKHVSANSWNTEMRKKAHATRATFKRPALWVLVFGWSLAACAGFVNTVAFESWGLYVSHVTGATTLIARRIEDVHHAEVELEKLNEAIGIVLSFVLGSFACGLLIDKNQVHFLGKAFYGVALVGNALLLVLAVVVQERLTGACFAAAACGLQNAMCTSHFGAVVRTTHVTGTATDTGSTLGRLTMLLLRNKCRNLSMNVVERAEVYVDVRKLLVLLPMWFSFLLGCVGGAYAYHLIKGPQALFVPAAITFTVGLGYMFFRQTLKDYIKGLEKERLNDDLANVHEALAHTMERLHDMQLDQTTRQSPGADPTEGDLVIELDEEVGHMMEALHEVEADVQNLCTDSVKSDRVVNAGGNPQVMSV
eukprot:TRINITY_DN5443_c0_g2_i1.p1 TRINITY_DN5443_c0_g2~~TRINITY_DN5443_c0_g2_i1.p1  ORF type:complete len:428 (+),score=58.88 TRINITY_DN5443_c0_g2_i1:77-1285(+)